ncbi:hypothetical protein CROQUDRAFT_134088 [Cronartium quercuum f. sp. fusiforme G11]|uniref:Uncharacterized protein n=1 Tax=Cronartium quercuum f. sp. fusiforme G11 TaxID=708437 RepID=A0A9P6NIL5_9BASI|nr:hypothetical protein CROQUDRAFT_134088 [Cronartium quercuum f. sp. fusiforme G11]
MNPTMSVYSESASVSEYYRIALMVTNLFDEGSPSLKGHYDSKSQTISDNVTYMEHFKDEELVIQQGLLALRSIVFLDPVTSQHVQIDLYQLVLDHPRRKIPVNIVNMNAFLNEYKTLITKDASWFWENFISKGNEEALVGEECKGF